MHALVVREDGGGGANLCTHVADGGHARAAHMIETWPEILHDGAGTTLYGQDARHLIEKQRVQNFNIK